MLETTQPSLYVAAYAAGVLMFFAPCSVGLLPTYFAYYLGSDSSSPEPDREPPSPFVAGFRIAAAIIGGFTFLAGAIPLFYMAVAGIRIVLPGHEFIVPLAKLGTGSYLPPVVLVLVGTLALSQGTGLGTARKGLRVGVVATLGVLLTYLVVGLPVVLVGQWLQPYLTSLELLAGPILVGIGVMYYRGVSPLKPVRLPERGVVSDSEFLLFGVIYGVGSLACNLPVFLGVVVSVFATHGPAEGLAVFGAFAAGMGTLMVGMSILAAGGEGTVSLGKYVGPVRRVGSAAFVVLGVYVTWYSLKAFGYL